MSTSVSDKDGQVEQGSSLYAALARTLTRSLALYFSRPVRIFKPSKGESLIILYCIQKDQTNIIILRLVSGWMFLRSLASQNGGSLSPVFIKGLVQQHGVCKYLSPVKLFLSSPAGLGHTKAFHPANGRQRITWCRSVVDLRRDLGLLT